MPKQPYIPFYIGDYIKDTRKLPLAVRGAWVDLILYMWDEPIKGEITGTIEEFAGMLSCTHKDCEFAINLLIEKKVCDHEKFPGGEIKIISRRMKKDVSISLKRSESGKKGNEAKAKRPQKKEFAEDLLPAKQTQNTNYEYEDDNESSFLSLGSKETFSFDLQTELPKNVLEIAEMNQFTHTKSGNTEFVKNQWKVFLGERMNDPPAKRNQYRMISDLTRYFLNWIRDKFPKPNGTSSKSNGKPIPQAVPSGGYGKL